jgi:hypothetical protein
MLDLFLFLAFGAVCYFIGYARAKNPNQVTEEWKND